MWQIIIGLCCGLVIGFIILLFYHQTVGKPVQENNNALLNQRNELQKEIAQLSDKKLFIEEEVITVENKKQQVIEELQKIEKNSLKQQQIFQQNINDAEKTALIKKQEIEKVFLQNKEAFSLQLKELENNIQIKEARKQEIAKAIEILEKSKQASIAQSDQALQLELNKLYEQFDNATAELGANYQKKKEEYQKALVNTIQEGASEYSTKIAEYKNELASYSKLIAEAKNNYDIIVEAHRREVEIKTQKDFYHITLSEQDLREITKLREVESYMRNSRPLCMAIWSYYYQTPTNDLINRIIGANPKTGIYKLTNILNGMVYIGQATNIRDRWIEHIKCGLGIDAKENSLYKAMRKDGVENFTFELIEECPRAILNKQEAYWINFYSSNTFGYNMNRGIGK